MISKAKRLGLGLAILLSVWSFGRWLSRGAEESKASRMDVLPVSACQPLTGLTFLMVPKGEPGEGSSLPQRSDHFADFAVNSSAATQVSRESISSRSRFHLPP